MSTTVTTNLQSLQEIVNDLSLLKRKHYIAGTNDHEDVAAHSLSVALMAWYLFHLVEPDLDITKIQQYAIVHDFVEIHAGDTNTFATKDERNEKEIRELEAATKITNDFSYFADMTTTLNAYQAMNDPEARFVWTADKIQALIHGSQDKWRAYYEKPITNDEFTAKMNELYAKSSPELQTVFADVINWCKTTYDYK